MLLLNEPKYSFKNFIVYNNIPKHDLEYLFFLISNKTKISEQLKKIGSGQFGTVFRYKNYAIKLIWDTYSEDVRNMVLLQGCKFYPKLYATSSNNVIIMEYIEGETIGSLNYESKLKISYKSDFKNMLKKAIIHAIKNDLDPRDLHGHNIMVRHNGAPVIVDVGHFRKKDDDNYNRPEVKDLSDVDDYLENDYRLNSAIINYKMYLKPKTKKKKEVEKIEVKQNSINYININPFLAPPNANIMVNKFADAVVKLDNAVIGKIKTFALGLAPEKVNFNDSLLKKPKNIQELINKKKSKQPNKFLEKKLGGVNKNKLPIK